MIARHRPRSLFTPADVERVRERFQTILNSVSEKPPAVVKPAAHVNSPVELKRPLSASIRKPPAPVPFVRRRKRA